MREFLFWISEFVELSKSFVNTEFGSIPGEFQPKNWFLSFCVDVSVGDKISQFLTGLVERLRTRKIVWHKKVTKNGDFTWVKIENIAIHAITNFYQNFSKRIPREFGQTFLSWDSHHLLNQITYFGYETYSQEKNFSEFSLNISNISHIYQLDNISICYVYGTDS